MGTTEIRSDSDWSLTPYGIAKGCCTGVRVCDPGVLNQLNVFEALFFPAIVFCRKNCPHTERATTAPAAPVIPAPLEVMPLLKEGNH